MHPPFPRNTLTRIPRNNVARYKLAAALDIFTELNMPLATRRSASGAGENGVTCLFVRYREVRQAKSATDS
jgi:hypothetical protein